MMKQRLIQELHVINKLNFHSEAIAYQHSFVYKVLNPFRWLKTSVQLNQLFEASRRYFNVSNEVAQLEIVDSIYSKLNTLLQGRRTFMDSLNPNEEEKQPEQPEQPNELQKEPAEAMKTPSLCSLDLIAYVYLKEQLRNTPDSNETKLLQSKYQNLFEFVCLMDRILDMNNEELGDQNMLQVQANVNLPILVSDVMRQHIDVTPFQNN